MKSYLELKRLEKAATNLRDRPLIRLLSHTGCRISEALALGVQDIDFQQGTVTIQDLKMRLRVACPHCHARLGRGHAFCPKCGLSVKKAVARSREHRRVRTLPVDSRTLQMFKDYIAQGGLVLGSRRELIFGINRHRAWQIVRVCAEKAGPGKLVNPETGRVRGVSPHRLRDAFATMAMMREDSANALRLLQEHLGHASFETTPKYRKVAGEEHRAWYLRLWEDRGL